MVALSHAAHALGEHLNLECPRAIGLRHGGRADITPRLDVSDVRRKDGVSCFCSDAAGSPTEHTTVQDDGK
jgi:hypothetical protein